MKQKKLHPVQERLLDLLTKNIDDPLTIRELQDSLNLSSTSVVAHHILQLEKKGYLKRNPSNPRDYHLSTHMPKKDVVYLNLYGLAHCGPSGELLDGSPIDRIPISHKLLAFSPHDAFMVKAKGDSMAPRIHKNDLVIAQKRRTAANDTIVVCVNEGEALIKKIHIENKKTILISLNPAYPPFLAADDFRIEGEVKLVISFVAGGGIEPPTSGL